MPLPISPVRTSRPGGGLVNDTQVYNEPAAERAWSGLLALYVKALA
ncbi:MAG: hypothetical protein Q8N52_05355 [Acidobacteriota bacterium]|nr:hypothetical protein [Acidobacteriota bacterium]